MPDTKKKNPWYKIKDEREIASPALLLYPDRVEKNIRRMISMAGTPSILRPHVKTHKMSAIVNLCRKHGIDKFKCATLAEVEMAARCGARDIMLAMQPVGPVLQKLPELQKKYPYSTISVILDNVNTLNALTLTDHPVGVAGDPVGVWVDINNGMNRTGIIAEKAFDLFIKVTELPGVTARGLHVYDGHIHDADPEMRKKTADRDFEPVSRLIASLVKSGITSPVVDAGGTPTFPIHVHRENTEVSPGTTFLWDAGYGEHYHDMDFLHAAVILSRIVSKPADDLVCLDLGHKAIAAEMPQPRVRLLDFPDHEFVGHNEEHLVLKTRHAQKYNVGDVVYGIPWHICPTVARYPFAFLVAGNRVYDAWQVDARDRIITV